MLKIVLPEGEIWDERTNEFFYPKEQVLQLEHSLVSLSKWEAKWHKPFMPRNAKKNDKTFEETIDYVRCMTITQNVSDDTYYRLTQKNLDEIYQYINDPMTATCFTNRQRDVFNNEIVTSELIYYWMITLGIPMECRKWHLNRLITLIRLCSIKTNPGKKMSEREIMNYNAALNKKRRAALHSKG